MVSACFIIAVRMYRNLDLLSGAEDRIRIPRRMLLQRRHSAGARSSVQLVGMVSE